MELGLRTSQAVRFASVSQFVDGALHRTGRFGRPSGRRPVRALVPDAAAQHRRGARRGAARAVPGHGAEPARARRANRCRTPPRITYVGLRLPPCMPQRAPGAARRLAGERWPRAATGHRRSWVPQTAPARRRRQLLRRPRPAGRAGQQPVRPGRHHPRAGRLRDRVEQAPRAARVATTPCGGWSSAPRETDRSPATQTRLREALGLSEAELERLSIVWEGRPGSCWRSVADAAQEGSRCACSAAAWNDYERAVERWCEYVADNVPPDLSQRPIYFVSSNMHSLVNLLSGSAHGPPGARSSTTSSDSDSELLRAEYEAHHVRSRAQQPRELPVLRRQEVPGRPAQRATPPARFAAEEHAAGMTHHARAARPGRRRPGHRAAASCGRSASIDAWPTCPRSIGWRAATR